MKCWFSILVLFAFAAVAKAENDALAYSVVVVRGTDEQKPPVEGAKPVSSKLAERLSRFRWKYYWEIRREAITVASKRPAKLQLSKSRALEVTLASNQQVEMHLHREGKIVRTARQKVASDSCEIMGGVDEKDSWFVIVRRKTD